jgi:hypothetical protein
MQQQQQQQQQQHQYTTAQSVAPETLYAHNQQLTNHAHPTCVLPADAPVDPAEGVEADPAADNAGEMPEHPTNFGVIPKRRLAGDLITFRVVLKAIDGQYWCQLRYHCCCYAAPVTAAAAFSIKLAACLLVPGNK